MKKLFTIYVINFLLLPLCLNAQKLPAEISRFYMRDSVRVTIDKPVNFKKSRETVIIFYALPNGNSTEQTMGKKMEPGDDWHFDIQHIRAQTIFIREKMKKRNIVVIYLENNLKSWPAWKQRHPCFKTSIPQIIDSLTRLFSTKRKSVYLNGHSGGGGFIFGYLAAVNQIPSKIKRISFIDSNYGYDSSYYPMIKQWLQDVKGAALNVFSYNDSVALYNGKPVVSATGGTWYRGHLMLKHFNNDFTFKMTRNDSLIVYKNEDQRLQFFFKKNPDRGIYHTQQVELNGFIHSILSGTKWENKGYRYYDRRAYTSFIF